MRIGFFGTPVYAVPSLRALLAAPGMEVAVVVTNPDRPRGRGMRLQPPPVKEAAAGARVPVWQPDRPRDIAGDLAALELDACAIVAYGALLPADVLAAGGAGFVNLHFSVLPAWRGAAPVQHTLLAGEAETGVTCFVLDEGMDTGPVLTVVRTAVRAGETAGELGRRLAELGAPALVDAVAGLVTGRLRPHPQPEHGATYAPKISADDARLDWARPAEVLERAVRAYDPAPGAHTSLDGRRVKIHRAHAVPGSGPPGAILRVDAGPQGGGPVVACRPGALRLDEVQPAGKARMTGIDFANGYRLADRRLGDGE